MTSVTVITSLIVFETRSKSLSPAQVAINNKHLSYHLGRLKRSYDNGLDESTVENLDETHIVVDMDN